MKVSREKKKPIIYLINHIDLWEKKGCKVKGLIKFCGMRSQVRS